MVWAPPFERRSRAWLSRIEERLRAIESREPERFKLLSQDDTFASVLISATQAAFRARHEEKLQLLGAAVEQSASGTQISADLQVLFVRFIDELTVSHVRLLRCLAEHPEELRTASSYETLRTLFTQSTQAAPTPEEFLLMCNDLTARVLLRISSSVQEFRDVLEVDYVITEGSSDDPLVRVTDLGRTFLSFVDAGATPRVA